MNFLLFCRARRLCGKSCTTDFPINFANRFTIGFVTDFVNRYTTGFAKNNRRRRVTTATNNTATGDALPIQPNNV
ncbi:MAG: hypothetical protein GX900_07590 [Clostridiaceae bacterium]|nr:hypothetical protein [Clostridiaceae bacterium]